VRLIAGPERVELEAGKHRDDRKKDDDDAKGAASLALAGHVFRHGGRPMMRYSVW
jgi:hypothetical protein